jgi:hypothetical protein
MINPKKDGWYLAYDMEWERVLFKNGRWISQSKTKHTGPHTEILIRDDITEHVTAWMELPPKPNKIEKDG